MTETPTALIRSSSSSPEPSSTTRATSTSTGSRRWRAAGITKGCNPPFNDMFCPNRILTRGEAATLLARALSLPDPGQGLLHRRQRPCPRGRDQSARRGRDHQGLQPAGQRSVLPRPGPVQGGVRRLHRTGTGSPRCVEGLLLRRQRHDSRGRHQPARRGGDHQRLQPTGQQPVLPDPRQHPGRDRHLPHQGPQLDVPGWMRSWVMTAIRAVDGSARNRQTVLVPAAQS